MVRNRNAAFHRPSGTRAAGDPACAPGTGARTPRAPPRPKSQRAKMPRGRPHTVTGCSALAQLERGASIAGDRGDARTTGHGCEARTHIRARPERRHAYRLEARGQSAPGTLDAVGVPVTGEGERRRIPCVVCRVLRATRRRQVRAEVRGSQRATRPQFRTRLRCTVTFMIYLHLSHHSLFLGSRFSNGGFLIVGLSLMYVSSHHCVHIDRLDYHHLRCTKLSL
ncbi:hypothetical protein EDB89DRAFT_328533 [Lactarius sanguifluus]|nr:hypothetical protein EDB89DRAFT_328533 [Lactarius sanguifluus]